jgi:glucoamylase
MGRTVAEIGNFSTTYRSAADLADLNHEASIATYLREIADVWNTSIERWIYASGTDWCRKFNVKGYYVRIESGEVASRFQKTVHVKNVLAAEETRLASHLVSPDALALVRFGLRAADDTRIRDTVKVIDTLLKVETPSGLTWHRYNDDGYGEHEDGAPFDGTGMLSVGKICGNRFIGTSVLTASIQIQRESRSHNSMVRTIWTPAS